jgi:hypothetical protein
MTTASDVPNTGFFGPQGLNYADAALPLLTDTRLAQPLSLSYTTPPLPSPLISVGPASLDLRLSSSAAETELWAVISDLWPDGSSHPLASGRLLSSFPNIVEARSLKDAAGDVVQPYGDYSAKTNTSPGATRTYQIEFWPIGNTFRPGDRIQLTVLGASAASVLGVPAVNSIQLGGAGGSRLLMPVVPAPRAASGTAARPLALSVVPARIRAARRACLRFRVTSRGRPVRHAQIRLGRRRATTGRRGMATLCVRLRPGKYHASARIGGYRSAHATIIARRGRAMKS